MDTLARSLIIADNILQKSDYLKMKEERYESFQSQNGVLFSKGELGISELTELAKTTGEPKQISGKQELVEQLINWYI